MMFNGIGKLVKYGVVKENDLKLTVSDLTPGIYLLNFSDNKGDQPASYGYSAVHRSKSPLCALEIGCVIGFLTLW